MPSFGLWRGQGRSWPGVPGPAALPEGIRLVFLPPYSSEGQPVGVWPLVNEAVANRPFPSLEALVDNLPSRHPCWAASRPGGGDEGF